MSLYSKLLRIKVYILIHSKTMTFVKLSVFNIVVLYQLSPVPYEVEMADG